MHRSTQFLNRFFLIFAAVIGLTGCGFKNTLLQSSSDCGSKETQEILQNIIKDEAESGLKNNSNLDLSKARATLEQIKITVNDVRTTKQDPNSSKKFCTGNIKVSIPSEIYANIEQAYKLTNQQISIQDAFEQDGFKVNANVLSKEFDFNAQPTDDNKSVYVELENAEALASTVGDLLTLDQMKGKLEARASEEKAQEVANTEAATAAAAAEYDTARRENLEARKSVNAAWNAMPKDQQSEMLAEQKAWVAQKKAQCGVSDDDKNATTLDFSNSEIVSKAIGKLNCDTNMTNQRLGLLEQGGE